MREILFKAKRLDNGEWVQGYIVRHPSAVQIGESSPWYIHVPPIDPDDSGGVFNVNPGTVCQYTGLTDKNGVKIFESDLMRFDNGEEEFSDYAVDWSNASWKVACDDGSFPDNLDEFFQNAQKSLATSTTRRTTMKAENCHGCKWLDEVKPYKGDGYCAHVERSKYYNTMPCAVDLGRRAPKIRRAEDERCELYCPGKFSERFKEADHEN